MEGFVKGAIVVLRFPFSDLSSSKKRPALVLADLPGDDIILCQITSQGRSDDFSVPLTNEDFVKGSLHKSSNIRVSHLFTADKSIILYPVGMVSTEKLAEVKQTLFKILS